MRPQVASTDCANKMLVRLLPDSEIAKKKKKNFSQTEGIQNGLLDFYIDGNVTSEAIATCIPGGLGLDNVSVCEADNASVNFGRHNSWIIKKCYSLSSQGGTFVSC